MKSVRSNKTKARTAPIRITLTEAEILEDLHYPVAVERIEQPPTGNVRRRGR